MIYMEKLKGKEIGNINQCFVTNGNHIVDFLWSREIFSVLSKELKFSKIEQEKICFMAIKYFSTYHNKNFFHGDIKPENIFVQKKSLKITSDAGTLIYLGDQSIDKPDDPVCIIN
jgi:serine/threonine protein kinase